MAAHDLSLTVFFPCHDEEDNVERTILSALEACRTLVRDYEIIVVNDGSTDRTGEIAERLSREHPSVRCVHNTSNLGYGGALQRGFREATKEWVFYTDGDGQFDMLEMETLLSLRAERTIVSAYRLNRQESVIRKLNAWCWSRLVNWVFAMRIRDVDCAFKLYPAKLFAEIEIRSTGALIDAEILAKALRRGYTITQVGVRHYPRVAGGSSGGRLSVILRAFRELWALRREICSGPRPA